MERLDKLFQSKADFRGTCVECFIVEGRVVKVIKEFKNVLDIFKIQNSLLEIEKEYDEISWFLDPYVSETSFEVGRIDGRLLLLAE